MRDVLLILAVAVSVPLLFSCGGRKAKTEQQPTPAPSATQSTAPEAPAAPAEQRRGRQRPGAQQEKTPQTQQKADPGGAPSSTPGSAKGQEAQPAPSDLDDRRTAREHLLDAMRFLDKGEFEAARPELEAVVRKEPGNEIASNLLKHLDADPEQVLGKDWFSYTVQSGDTLSKIAKRFLGEEYRFYLLARYNGIDVPGDLTVGQTLKIPGAKPPPPKPSPPPAPAPVKEPPPAAKTPPSPKASEADQSADKLYQGGVQALSAKAPDRAYELFSQALRVNPKHAGAQQKLGEIGPAAVEAYYKKAVAAYRRQDMDETIRLCNKALEIDPDNERVKLRRAEAMELKERIRKFK